MPWGISPSLLSVESFFLTYVLLLCPRGCSACWHVLVPLSLAAAYREVMGLRVSGKQRRHHVRKEVTSSALPLWCVHIIPGTSSPRCFARQPGNLPRRAGMNCEKATGLLGWMLSWCYLSGQELQNGCEVRPWEDQQKRTLGSDGCLCLLDTTCTQHRSLQYGTGGQANSACWENWGAMTGCVLPWVWCDGNITLFRLGAWEGLACICQFVLQTPPVQTQGQGWVLGQLHDEKSAARGTAQGSMASTSWASICRGTQFKHSFCGSRVLCPNDWEFWATLNGKINCSKSSKYSVIRGCSWL